MKIRERPTLTLYCFPCAGASASTYFRWRKNLPKWLEVQPVELPGRGTRIGDNLLRDFDSLVQQLSTELIPTLPTTYALFGHSLGALLAYGCAHNLRERRAHSPLALVAACCAAPSRRDDEHYTRLNSDEELIQELRNLSGTPATVFEHPDLLRMTIDVFRADIKVCASFRYETRDPLPTNIFVFGGRDDDIGERALEAWNVETSAHMKLEMFAGGHFFIREEEGRFLHYLLNDLRSCLAAHSNDAAWVE
ncbi:MAG TPA: alpha/beta fold hydrolase [Methylocella sp.]|nr:alpha/beta fold hydrolase [Methylocella sp.]